MASVHRGPLLRRRDRPGARRQRAADHRLSWSIFRLADAGIVARAGRSASSAVLGDIAARGRAADRAPGRRGAPAGRRSRAAPPARRADPAARAAGRAAAGRRTQRRSASAPRWWLWSALFWFAVDYGSEYAAPLLPYRPAGQARRERLRGADGRQGRSATARRAWPRINGLANRLARAADYPHRDHGASSSRAGRSTPSPCRAASW